MQERAVREDARYLYCVCRTDDREDLGGIGIEDSPVYILPSRGIAAIVHRCEPLPYDTSDQKKAQQWVLEHAYVIDRVMMRYGTVLPFSFDVIVKGGDDAVLSWLEDNRQGITETLDRLEGKAEYSVQLFYGYDNLAQAALQGSDELMALQSSIEKESRGRAYLLRRNLDMKLKEAVSARSKLLSEEAGSRIRSIADDLRIDERKPRIPEKYREMKLLASFSCLLSNEGAERLGDYLEDLRSKDGITVRFTGPWAPFSFVEAR